MTKPLALIVDDEPDILELLEITLDRMGVSTQSAANLKQARELLRHHRFDLCLTDLNLPDGNGLELVEYIQQKVSSLPTAVITAYGSMESAIQALKLGAFDFVSKPVDLKILKNLVSAAIKLNDDTTQSNRRSRDQLLGESPNMSEIRSKIVKLARSQAPVYISGESGTGKELVARLIHEKGPRADQPFVAINCGAIPHDLMESELFGHKKGAFTGAVQDKLGLLLSANGGTVFLDEIADLPLHMQVKLLRVVQEKSVRPVGEEREKPVDIRFLSATHKNLEQLVEQGNFRQDLYYRINVIQLHLPALRERQGDIPLLAKHILNNLARGHDMGKMTFTKNALNALERYPFPGNVRELENILERAATLSENQIIHEGDLHLPTATTSERTGDSNSDGLPLEDFLGSIEKEAITKALEKCRWNKTAAAKELGITFRALRYRLQKLGLDD